MNRLDVFEQRLFAEGPRFCLQLAGAVFAAGLGFSLLGGLLSQDGLSAGSFRFAALLAVPALLLCVLSFTLSRRHWGTVPIVVAICAFVVRFFLTTPDQAFAGIRVSTAHYAIGWIIVIMEVAAIGFAIWFAFRLLARGAFK